ncbi:SufS family cysteine desulfurase [Lactobacillaceae bacterium 24-114]
MVEWKAVREDFPLLTEQMHGEQLAYLDNAATSQKPVQVIEALTKFYSQENANVHRGTYGLSIAATEQYELAREKTQKFLHATSPKEIIFTHGATDSLNLVAATYGQENVHEGDEIVLTIAEHHSNLVPWQQLALKRNAHLKYIMLTQDGQLDLEDAKRKITKKTKIVIATHVSNVLGTIMPLKGLAKLAHENGAIIVADGAQAVMHLPVNVQKLDVDFYAFSGHKMLGPTGIGVLYGKEKILQKMSPYQFGGEMIMDVELNRSSWADLPHKFEAGTPNIAGVVGLKTAIEYLQAIGMENIQKRDEELLSSLFKRMEAIRGLTVYSPQQANVGVISFNIDGIHAHDAASALDLEGVAVRAGHHCAEPLMHLFGVPATLRASLAFYNNQSDCEQLIHAITETKEFFHRELK